MYMKNKILKCPSIESIDRNSLRSDVDHIHDIGYAFLLMPQVIFVNYRVCADKSSSLGLETSLILVH